MAHACPRARRRPDQAPAGSREPLYRIAENPRHTIQMLLGSSGTRRGGLRGRLFPGNPFGGFRRFRRPVLRPALPGGLSNSFPASRRDFPLLGCGGRSGDFPALYLCPPSALRFRHFSASRSTEFVAFAGCGGVRSSRARRPWKHSAKFGDLISQFFPPGLQPLNRRVNHFIRHF